VISEENLRLKQRPAPYRPAAAVAAQPALALAPAAAPAPAPAPAPTPFPTPAVRTYVVVDGDTLTKISLQFYGTARRWREIYDANRDTLPNESVLSIGSTLVIP
jgi:nucleoid-associated protein YgaU